MARSEFIRTQIAMESIPPFAPRRFVLEETAQRLLDQYRATWLQEIQVWARKSAKFRRGFVAHIETTARQFLKGGKGLFRRAPVQSVAFRPGDAIWKELFSNPL